jgi:CRISPR/Cas system-associated exonuclease Cas4 (RecB family)
MSRSAANVQNQPDEPTIPFDYDEPQITAVSFSRMNDFEECAFRALLKYARKIPEPKPVTDKETPLDRGSRIHDDAEQVVRGLKELTPELQSFEADFMGLRERFARQDNSIELEQMWCFDSEWQPVEWNDWGNIWLRVKQDAVVRPDPDTVIAIDYKSGRFDGNQVKHNTQLRIALLAAIFRYPKAKRYIAENWYVDKNIHFPIEYTRAQVLDFYDELDGRLRAVTTATRYTPAASKDACRWCPYKTGSIDRTREGTGDCPYSV